MRVDWTSNYSSLPSIFLSADTIVLAMSVREHSMAYPTLVRPIDLRLPY
jgi:hypothetical protein